MKCVVEGLNFSEPDAAVAKLVELFRVPNLFRNHKGAEILANLNHRPNESRSTGMQGQI